MTPLYKHTQGAGAMAWLYVVPIVGLGLAFGATGHWPVLLPVLLLIPVSWVFTALTVTVEPGTATVSFRGVFRKRLDLRDVADVRAVQNRWTQGWGIRWLGTGWMWNIAGFDAVELEFRDGAIFRIGTDEPQKLAAAVEAARPAIRP